MPCILPVSGLRNYNEVLQNVSEGFPVFLTKKWAGLFCRYRYQGIRAYIQGVDRQGHRRF